MYVITGATGNLGRLVIKALLAQVPAEQVTALVRDASKAVDLADRGVQLRVADYSDAASLADAFHAGERVLLISGSEVGQRVPQHRAVLEAARRAGVALLAYTSVLGAPTADFELAREHQETEKLLADSGLPYVLLRNGWYHENYTGNLEPVLAHGAVVSNAGDGRVASAARADYAAAAAAVLTGEGHAGHAYELSGDTAWTFDEYAAELSRQTGREIVHHRVSEAEHRDILTGAGLPEPYPAILADVDSAVARGLLAATPGDLARLTGRPTTPLATAIAEALRDHPTPAP